MRQRRQRLQVSTFPFLAVLLCAMGSLILLLLVMDRRAKVVARAKAMRTMEQALAQVTAEEERAATAQRAEWERRRQMLHEQLAQQDQHVLDQLQSVQKQITAATTGAQTELARSRDLQEQLEVERSGLVRTEDELVARRTEMDTAGQQADASRTELTRLTADLERMERCIADLKVARQRQQETVSLVPYRGKRGDNRRPVYIECSAEDVIFHPDHLALPPSKAAAIRDEIEQRVAGQHSGTVNKKPEENAYLLMLVRPNGIATYYRTLAALTGLRVDFGYEFIDQDWILDFSEDDDKPKKQPWLAADRTKEKQPSDRAAKETASGTSLSGGLPRPQQQPSSSGAVLGRPRGILAAASAGAGNAPSGTGVTGAGREDPVAAGSAGNGTAGEQGIAAAPGAAKSGLGTEEGTGPPLAQVFAGEGRSSTAREAFLYDNAGPTSYRTLGQGGPRSSPRGAAGGTDSTPLVVDGKLGTGGQPADGGTAQGPRREEASGETGKPGLDVAPSLLPPSALSPSRGTGNTGVSSPQDAASESAVRASPTQGPSASGESPQGPAGDPLDRLRAKNPPPKPVRATAVRPGPLVGNRDWIIAIECTADALVLLPSRQRIATAQLAKRENGNNSLLEAVQQMIARRQATVRPGEPPYRPLIRFRVQPDGLRSYHLAYPALEALHVPMARENVDPEETKAAKGER